MTISSASHISSKPRVVQILSGDLWAGAENMAVQLIRHLAGQPNYRLTTVLLNPGPVAAALRHQEGRVIVMDESRLSFPRMVLLCRRILKDIRPEIVHTHRYKENLLGYLATRGSGRNPLLVTTMHGLPEGQGGKSRAVQALNFFLLARCFQHCVAVSREMQNRLIDAHQFPPDRISVVHNGIEIPEKRPAGSSCNFTIGACGRLCAVKNFGLFVKMAARAAAGRPHIRFVLAGNGPEKPLLQQLCRRHQLDGLFDLPGHVDDIRSFYKSLDCYVSTSLHEGLPLSVLEAMAAELPVIAPAVGGLVEIIDDGVDGFLIPGHDPDLFAEKCLELLAEPERRTTMGRAARRKVRERFSAERMASDYDRLYRELIASSGTRREK